MWTAGADEVGSTDRGISETGGGGERGAIVRELGRAARVARAGAGRHIPELYYTSGTSIWLAL